MLDFLSVLKKHLSSKRLDHSKRVADYAGMQALKWNVDTEKAYVAGLLHDCAKELSPIIFKDLNIECPDDVHSIYDVFPSVWHSFSGPYFAKHFFDIKDTEILNAMRWHTTGRKNMSDLECIVYLSDFLEPKNEFLNKQIFLDFFEFDLNSLMYISIMYSLFNLYKRNLTIYPSSIECYNFFLNRSNKNDSHYLFNVVLEMFK